MYNYFLSINNNDYYIAGSFLKNTKTQFILPSPANTSISKTRNVLRISPSLLTTFVILRNLSIMTCPMMFFHGRKHSRRFKWAIWPIVSKAQGDSVNVAGRIDFIICSIEKKFQYDAHLVKNLGFMHSSQKEKFKITRTPIFILQFDFIAFHQSQCMFINKFLDYSW